jgi:hypothetical protein
MLYTFYRENIYSISNRIEIKINLAAITVIPDTSINIFCIRAVLAVMTVFYYKGYFI